MIDPAVGFDPPLDPGIAPHVLMLRERGVETFESCEGGAGHAYAEPTVRFAKELQAWVQTFPADFYRELFRLRGLETTRPTQ